jgi:ABC-type uncharacterized transport system permease subunit
MSSLLKVAVIVSVLSATIRIATPLLLAATGELVVEHSGIWNMGVEGTMLVGAFFGFLIAHQTGSLWIGVTAAMIAGAVMSLVIVFMASTLKLDQFVIGMALNLFASGITLFLFRAIYQEVGAASKPTIEPFNEVMVPLLSRIPFVGEILFSHRILTYVAFLMVPVVSFFLYRTKHGLIIRSIGENPRAADMKGLNVAKYQYAAVIFGGLMSGAGGAFITLGSTGLFIQEITAGRGWLAIVIVIAGNWKPGRILLAALAFALLDAFQLHVQGIGVQIPHQILLALPYVLAVVVMMTNRARSAVPASLAIPYIRE